MFFVVFQDGKEHIMKEVVEGDSVHSLLSILDVLTVSNSTAPSIGNMLY